MKSKWSELYVREQEKRELLNAFQVVELFNRADILDCKRSKFQEKMLKMNVTSIPLVMYLIQMRTKPQTLYKVLGIDPELVQGQLQSLHDLLNISDHRFKQITSSHSRFTLKHIEKMKALRSEHSEFLSQVAALRVSKLDKNGATLRDYFQLHGKSFSKIGGGKMSFSERQSLEILYDQNQPIENVVRRACISCGLEKEGLDFQDAVKKFRRHGIQTGYDFHCLDEDTLLDRLSELNNWRLCDSLICARNLREKRKSMIETSFNTSRHEVFCSMRLMSITDLNTAQMSFRSDFLMFLAWNDPIGLRCLKKQVCGTEKDAEILANHILSHEEWTNIAFHPQITIANLKDVEDNFDCDWYQKSDPRPSKCYQKNISNM